ncbi:MAG: hypothetical protein JWM32_2165 [Verrucomicrobia bacterium]|nr:hypothetical protein [Verrucomicrobiota bacterium]
MKTPLRATFLAFLCFTAVSAYANGIYILSSYISIDGYARDTAVSDQTYGYHAASSNGTPISVGGVGGAVTMSTFSFSGFAYGAVPDDEGDAHFTLWNTTTFRALTGQTTFNLSGRVNDYAYLDIFIHDLTDGSNVTGFYYPSYPNYSFNETVVFNSFDTHHYELVFSSGINGYEGGGDGSANARILLSSVGTGGSSVPDNASTALLLLTGSAICGLLARRHARRLLPRKNP